MIRLDTMYTEFVPVVLGSRVILLSRYLWTDQSLCCSRVNITVSRLRSSNDYVDVLDLVDFEYRTIHINYLNEHYAHNINTDKGAVNCFELRYARWYWIK